MYGFGMGLGWVIPLIGLGLIVYFFVNQKNINIKAGKSALDILDERYAKGEIDEEEYQKKHEILASN